MTNFEINSEGGKAAAKLKDSKLRQLISDQEEADKQLVAEQQLLAEQFKQLREQGAPKQVVMDALGITEDDYAKFSSREDVKQAVVNSEIARATANQTFDSNWDAVENLALQQVARELKVSPDPEYALRAAAVANKAVRRRREEAKLAAQGAAFANQQVNTNNIAILTLPKVFMQQLVVETEESAKRQLELQKGAINRPKLVDMADVSVVREQFGMNRVEQAIDVTPRIASQGTANSQQMVTTATDQGDLLEEWLTDGSR